MGSFPLPDHAKRRYKIMVTEFRGCADVALFDRDTGDQFTQAAVYAERGEKTRRVPLGDVDDVVHDLVRFADGARPVGDPIGDAARAALALERLRRTHAAAPEHLVDPLVYRAVLAHLADAAARVGKLAGLGAAMSGTYGGLARDALEHEGNRRWRRAGELLARMRRRAQGAEVAAYAAAVQISNALAYDITCGACVEGICHSGDGPMAARAAEEAGRRCDCYRHAVSVRLRAALGRDVRPNGPFTMDPPYPSAYLPGPFRADDPAGWASIATLDGVERVMIADLGDKVAEMLLRGEARTVGTVFGTDAGPVPPTGTVVFVNRHGVLFPRYSMDEAPAELDERQRVQFAREVWHVCAVEREAIEAAGAALFDVPGGGLLLVPAEFDLAAVCIRLGVEVEAERSTRAPDGTPARPVIIDDVVRERDR